MRSPTSALLWEIWHRHRSQFVAVIGVTVAARLIASQVVIDLLALAAFGMLLAALNYTDSSSHGSVGRFPPRLFVLPVSTLTLVAIPMLVGIASIALLYLAWMDLMSRGGTTSAPFIALLLGALVVFYHGALWTLDRLGAMRLVVIGAVVFGVFLVGILPSLPPTPAPAWRSEAALAAWVAALAVITMVVTWKHVELQRRGGRRRLLSLDALADRIAARSSRTRSAFASPAAAQFWFEWRSSGLGLPIFIGGLILISIAPRSWIVRHDAGEALELLHLALLMPIVQAIPVGMAFAKPTFWSQDVSMPPFMAVRPLSDEDIIVTKMKVAAVSVLVTWTFVLAFIAAWLSLWANLDAISRVAITLWAFHGHSIAAVCGIAVLLVVCAMLLSWRVMVSRLWSGLLGNKALFVVSVVSVPIVVTAAIVLGISEFPSWLVAEPSRMNGAVWIAALAVLMKYWLAVWSWQHGSLKYARQYLIIWGAGTACFVMLALVVWNVAHLYVAQDIHQLQALLVLTALLVMPLVRPGLSPASLARNRHR